jgi:hypothetical protein
MRCERLLLRNDLEREGLACACGADRNGVHSNACAGDGAAIRRDSDLCLIRCASRIGENFPRRILECDLQ